MEHENNPSPEPREPHERRPLALDEFVEQWRAAVAVGPRTQSSFEVEHLEELPPADVEAARELLTALVTSEDEETNSDDDKLPPDEWAWLSQAYELGQVMRGPRPKIDPIEAKAEWNKLQDALRREAEYLGIDMEEELRQAERENWRRAEEEVRYLFDDLDEGGSGT